MKILLWIMMLLVFVSLGATQARAHVFVVNSPPLAGEFSTITDAVQAVNATSFPPPHTISIKGGPGTVYNESFDKWADEMFAYSVDELTIEPYDLLSNIIIDAQGLGPCLFAMECDNLTINYITFRNGDATLGHGDSLTDDNGGGLYLRACKNVVLFECKFENNSAASGGGGYFLDSDVALINCEMIGNLANKDPAIGDGGALCLENSVAYAPGFTAKDNIARVGGGAVWLSQDSYMRWFNGVCTNNEAGSLGGAVYIADSSGLEVCGDVYQYRNMAPPGTWVLGHIETANGTALLGDTGWQSVSDWTGNPPTNQAPTNCPAKMATYRNSPQPISMLNMPDGSGTCFSGAYLYGGPPYPLVDATISIWGFPEGTPGNSFWLGFQGTTNFNVYSGNRIEAVGVVRYGKIEIEIDSIQAGGFTVPVANQCFVTTPDDDEYPLEIYFNSPDMTGDGSVCLLDVAWFLYCWKNTPYHYAADFNGDGVLNISDLTIITAAYGMSWNSSSNMTVCD